MSEEIKDIIEENIEENIKDNTEEVADEITEEVNENAETEENEAEEADAKENGTVETEEIVPVENPKAVVESVLFAMGNSVEVKKLASVIGMSVSDTKALILEMQEEYNNDANRGVTIVELEGAVQMCSKTEMYEHLMKIATVPKHYTLTDAVLETLSIVAYKQPVTRIEIEKIRGVNCDHAVNKLLEYGLIAELGRLDAPGRPLLFGTTEEFLRCFGVKSLEELPTVTADRLDQFKKEAAEEIQMSLPI